MRVILYTGKGGVGKTTLAAATALHCAALGHQTLVVSTDTAHSLADALQTPLGNEPRPVGQQGLEAAELDSASELERAWGEIKQRISTLLQQDCTIAEWKSRSPCSGNIPLAESLILDSSA